MTEKDLSRAPWTEQQVENLRIRQEIIHPYTCNGSEGGYHKTVSLEPRIGGLYCPICPYIQAWAHAQDVYVRRWWL